VVPSCYVYEFVGDDGVLESIMQGCDDDTRILTAGGAPGGERISAMVAQPERLVISFGGGPKYRDRYGTLDAISTAELDPSPVIGTVVDLEGLPDPIELARRTDGPARIMIHPNGDVS
jgi:threonine dehydrogenase-like Zn-dependent dehydrogenase